MHIEFPNLSIQSFIYNSSNTSETPSIQLGRVNYTTVNGDALNWVSAFNKVKSMENVLCYPRGIVPVVYDGKLYPLCDVGSFDVDYDKTHNLICVNVILNGYANVVKQYYGMLRYVSCQSEQSDEEYMDVVPFLIGDAKICELELESSSLESSSSGSSNPDSSLSSSSELDFSSSDSSDSSESEGGCFVRCDCDCSPMDDNCCCLDGGPGVGDGDCKVCDCKCCVNDCPESSNDDVSSEENDSSGSQSSKKRSSSKSSSSTFDEDIFTKTILLKDGTQIMFLVLSEKAFDYEYFSEDKFKKVDVSSIQLPNGEIYSLDGNADDNELPQPFDRGLFFAVSKSSLAESDVVNIYKVPFLHTDSMSFSFAENINKIDIKFIEDQNRILISYKQYPDYVGIKKDHTKYGLFNVGIGMLKFCAINGGTPCLTPLIFDAEFGSANPMSSSLSSLSSLSLSSSDFSSELSSDGSETKPQCNIKYVDFDDVAETGKCQPSMWKCEVNDAQDTGGTEYPGGSYDPNEPTEGEWVKCCCPLYDKGDEDVPEDPQQRSSKCEPSWFSSCWAEVTGHNFDIERVWLDSVEEDEFPVYGIPAVLELANGISMVFYYKPVLSDLITTYDEDGTDIVRGALSLVSNGTFTGSAAATKDKQTWDDAEKNNHYHEDCDYYFNVLFWSVLDNKTGKLSNGFPVPSLLKKKSENSDSNVCEMKFSLQKRRYNEVGDGPILNVSYDKMTNVLLVDGIYGTIRQCGYEAVYGRGLQEPDSNTPNFVPILFSQTLMEAHITENNEYLIVYPQDCENENSWSSSSNVCYVQSWGCPSEKSSNGDDPIIPTPEDPTLPGASSGDATIPKPEDPEFPPIECEQCDQEHDCKKYCKSSS